MYLYGNCCHGVNRKDQLKVGPIECSLATECHYASTLADKISSTCEPDCT